MKFGIGQSVRRTEDSRFVTGQGQYTEDLHFGGETHAAFLRSPYAHARITSIDTSAAEAAPGVTGVLTWKEVEAAGAWRRSGTATAPPSSGRPSRCWPRIM
jgi:aerobic carbon-monoxide dehydrogenase large subunit